MIGDAGQDIRKIGFRIEAVQLGRLDDGIEYSSPLAAGIRRDLIMPGAWDAR
jgi:hypothetical protein